MLTSPDTSMLEDLTIDELRWLEASQIMEFSTSASDRVMHSRFSRSMEDGQRPAARTRNNLNDAAKKSGQVPCIPQTPIPRSPTSPARKRGSRRLSPPSPLLPHPIPPPTPPRTPSRRGSPTNRLQDSPSEWIYRRPNPPATHRISPSTSALSSSLSLSKSSTSTSLARSQSTASTMTEKPASTASDKRERHRDSGRQSSNAPFWATVLRPRSRSMRSIPLLKTIPSQSQVNLHSTTSTFSGPNTPSTDPSSTAFISRPMRQRPPSISSTLSSVSSHSSSRPETPVTPCDPSEGFRKPKVYHRRYVSNPTHDPKLPPLSSSCPSKSILTRTSSISTKDSAATASKSVKFVEIPTVHYASAGYWDVETVDRMNIDDPRDIQMMGIDMDHMDVDYDEPSSALTATSFPFGKRGYTSRPALSRTEELHEFDRTTPTPEKELEKAKGLKRLMNLGHRSFAPAMQKASPASPALIASPASTRPIISGPYALGSHPLPPLPSSPTLSTASLKSNCSHRSRAKGKAPSNASSSSSSTNIHLHNLPANGSVPLRTIPSLENCRSAKNTAARSVRSLGSVKSTSSTRRFKSWLGRAVGNSWSVN